MNARAGFTLIEMLIVTLLGAVVMGSIYQMVNIQDQTTRQQYAIVQNNQNARMALAVLTADLKEMSARDGDVSYADSTILEFRALRKAGLACDADPGGTYADVSEIGDAFAAGDSVLVFTDGASVGSATDDGWVATRVAGVGAIICVANPLGVVSTKRVSFTAPVAGVAAGALVRSFVRTRYQLADDGDWGVIERTETGAATQPIIEGLATIREGGLHMRFIDSTSAVIPYNDLRQNGARLGHIMRIEMKVRGKAATQVTTTGNRFSDSLVTQVYVRGNARSR